MSVDDRTLAAYFVHWTVDRSDHDVNIDLVIGQWGKGTAIQDRFLVTVLFRPSREGGSFMVTDATPRLQAKASICSRGMLPGEVVGLPLATEVFSLLDGIWNSDPRIDEVRSLNVA